MADETPGIGVMLGHGAEIACGGRVWKLSAPDQNAKVRLEKLAMAFALQDVEKLEGTLPPASFDRAYKTALKSLPEYRTWGSGWQSVVFGNSHYFLWSLLQGNHPGITEDTVREILAESPEGVAAAYAQVIPDFFRLLTEEKIREVPKKRQAEVRAEVAKVMDPLLASMVEQLRQYTPTSST